MGNGPSMQQITGTQATNVALQHVNQQRTVQQQGAYMLPVYGEGGVQAYKHAIDNGMQISKIMKTLFDRSYDINPILAPDDIVPLYYSRGTMLASDSDVCEFEIAGSSFKTFRKDHKNLKGKNPSMGWFKRLMHKWFGFFSKDANEETRTRDVFGDSSSVDKVQKEHVRVKNYGGNKRKITISGPGAFDVGEYSISNIREYIESCGKQYLIERVLEACGSALTVDQVSNQQLLSMAPPKDARKIVLRLKGHSRGAVAEIEGAKMLKAWIDSNLHSRWRDLIAFDIIQFDPVPGADVLREEHCQVDVNKTTTTHDGKTLGSLAGCCSSTVVYSMYQEHNVLQFTPMSVKGTDRIILTPFKHSVGLDRVDRQKSIRDQAQGQMDAVSRMKQMHIGSSDRIIADGEDGHAAVYVDTEHAKAYSRDALNELPKGVYIMDEYGRIQSIHSVSEVDRVMDMIYSDKITEGKRKSIIHDVVQEWFTANKTS